MNKAVGGGGEGGWEVSYGANADTFGEAVVGLDVLVKLLHCLLSQG